MSIATILACGCGERRSLMCSSPSTCRIERIARRAAHHVRPGGRRQAAAEGGAGGGVLDIGLAVERVLDRAIAGAAADIALQRGAEVLPLRLVQRGAGQDHAGGAEAALKSLRIEEGLLHRMRAAVAAKTFDGGDRVPLGAKRRDQAAMHRLAVEQHGAGAAIAGVAALLDAEMAELAQERAQALPGARRLREWLAVDLESSCACALQVRRGFPRRAAASCACATSACRGRRCGRASSGIACRIASRSSLRVRDLRETTA